MQRVDIASKLAIPNALPKDCFDVPLIDPDLTADPVAGLVSKVVAILLKHLEEARSFIERR